MRNFLQHADGQRDYIKNNLPKTGNNWSQKPSESLCPQQTAGEKTNPVPNTDIALADLKTEIQPCKKDADHENDVAESANISAERPKKIIY